MGVESRYIFELFLISWNKLTLKNDEGIFSFPLFILKLIPVLASSQFFVDNFFFITFKLSDVNNLDNYRTIHEVVEETKVSKSPASKKRRHSSSDPGIRIVKKARKSTTHKNVDKKRTSSMAMTQQKCSYNLDVNLEIVPQWASIQKTISKESVSKTSETTTSDSRLILFHLFWSDLKSKVDGVKCLNKRALCMVGT